MYGKESITTKQGTLTMSTLHSAPTSQQNKGFKNTNQYYGTITKTFHWLTALLIIAVIATGVSAHDMSISDPVSLEWKVRLYSIHKTIGLTIFCTALLRILWALSQPKPAMIGDAPKSQTFLAEVVHYALYISLVLVPLTGWMTHAATEGFAPIKWPFGQDLPFIPNDPELAEHLATAHKFFERVMVASLLLHIAGAVKHHVIDKDATLRRMWFGKTNLSDALFSGHARGAAPALAALVIFAAVGTAAALQPVGKGSIDAPALEEVSSDWRVLEGEIEITVVQFGTEVSGSFADWTAAISFDPAADGDIKGSAEVTVSVGSLTLGSVTGEALAPDMLAATDFPTALVAGDILSADEGYVLEGTITIREQAVPLSLPFNLDINDDIATAKGGVALQRLDFGVGETTDSDTVGLEVGVSINLTATNAEDAG